jgi:hypothetical protein
MPYSPFVIIVATVDEGSGGVKRIPLTGFPIETIVFVTVHSIPIVHTREQGIPTLKDCSQVPVLFR